MRNGASVPLVSIVGLGNVLLGDDGFGCLAVEIFRCEYECASKVEVIDLGTPGLDLAPYLYGKDLVVIVDAVTADGRPGTVRTYNESDLNDCRTQLRLTDHDSGLQESLGQLRLAGSSPSEIMVVGVIPESCAFGEAISPVVWAATSTAIESILRLLRERGFECRKRRHPRQPRLWWICDSTSNHAGPATAEPDAQVVSRR
jgi:hydrogenase maturation protease